MVGWYPPPDGWLKLNSDGAVSGVSGLACAGGLLRNSDGKWAGGFIMNIGICSVLRSELWGMLQGISFDWSAGFRKLLVECDNKTVVQMIVGEVMPHAADLPLINSIKALINLDWTVKVVHVYREANRAADWLASFASQFPRGLHVLQQAPASINDILYQDFIGVSSTRMVIV